MRIGGECRDAEDTSYLLRNYVGPPQVFGGGYVMAITLFKRKTSDNTPRPVCEADPRPEEHGISPIVGGMRRHQVPGGSVNRYIEQSGSTSEAILILPYFNGDITASMRWLLSRAD
jgi:hypothetical protein